MEDMDLSEDLEEILFLLEDNIFVRWRIDLNFFNQSIYGRLFERGNRGAFGDLRNMNLPEIKGGPNTTKLMVGITSAAMFHSGRDQFHNKNFFCTFRNPGSFKGSVGPPQHHQASLMPRTHSVTYAGDAPSHRSSTC